MSDDLVKRLRIPCFEIGLDECWIDPERIEAADRIEELLAEIERLRNRMVNFGISPDEPTRAELIRDVVRGITRI